MSVAFVLELVLLLDLLFGFDVLKATTFTELLNLQTMNDQSFYSYFFFSCLSSGVAYLSFSFFTLISYLKLIFQAFSFFDWVLITAFVFLCISHRTKQSKVSFCILSGYFIMRFLILFGISIYLIQAMDANSATAVLSRIQISSIFLIFIHALVFIGNGVWLVRLIKDCYLKQFNENDSH